MATYLFATDRDADRFSVEGATLQDAFESLTFRAESYADDEDDAEDLRGKTMGVWAWDDEGDRYDWIVMLQ